MLALGDGGCALSKEQGLESTTLSCWTAISAPIPDPRAMWMPNGVHGSSRVYDAGAFKWTDEHWNAPPLSSGVVYEMHIGTFTPEGTFDSAIERLRHLAELGVSRM